MSTVTLLPVRQRRLAQEHADLLRAAIERYRDQAKQMLKLARVATRDGNAPLALGYLDLAQTYRAMANSLADQQLNVTGEQR